MDTTRGDEARLQVEIEGELKDFVNEFNKASDRAAVLVVAAMLDDLLEKLLLAELLPTPSRDDDLFDGDRPLSTFAARISLAHRMGLIDAPLASALHLFRKMRNDFAHQITGCSLTTGAQHDRMRALAAQLRSDPRFVEQLARVPKGSLVPADFVAVTVSLVMRLLIARKIIEALGRRPPAHVAVLVNPAITVSSPGTAGHPGS